MQPRSENNAAENLALIGEMFGSHRIQEQIGSGSTGTVYRGYDAAGQVAIKVLNDRCASQRSFRERFRLEAEAMHAITHPNVVRVFAFGTTPSGRPYLAMELARGSTLADTIAAEAPIPWKRAAHLVREIARGLAAVHEKGFIHRDLKPGNVMVLAGSHPERIKLFDFGIVGMVTDPGPRLTGDGLVLGTPTYMAPEQMFSSSVGPGADLYALGIILFELLTGHPPFEGGFSELAAQHLLAPPTPLPECGGLEGLAARLLAKDATERPPSAEAVVPEIDTLLRATPVARPWLRTPRFSGRGRRPSRRSWLALAGTCLALVAGVSTLAFRAPQMSGGDPPAVAVEAMIPARQTATLGSFVPPALQHAGPALAKIAPPADFAGCPLDFEPHAGSSPGRDEHGTTLYDRCCRSPRPSGLR